METWLDCDLFVGFEMTPAFAAELEGANPCAVLLFMHGEEKSYLTVVNRGGREWIGKVAETPLETGQIELLQANIYSLVKRLVPSFNPQKNPLHLFAMARSESVSS